MLPVSKHDYGSTLPEGANNVFVVVYATSGANTASLHPYHFKTLGNIHIGIYTCALKEHSECS